MEPNTEPKVHLYLLLDRSGSMASMAADVVEGFNALLAEQATAGGVAARMTFVQFDSEDPQEIIADADARRSRYVRGPDVPGWHTENGQRQVSGVTYNRRVPPQASLVQLESQAW